jgi:signal transduction histidine kinase/integral membrane sensor domain MASE1
MALRFAFIGAVYFAAHLLGLISHGPGILFTVVWPASGVGVAALLLSPRRQWTAVAGVLYAAGLCADHAVHRDAPAGWVFMVANVLESVLAAWFIERIGRGKVTFDKVREVLALAFASTAINALSASIGAATAMLAYGTSFTHMFQVWWVENSVAMVLFTSLIVAFAGGGSGRERPSLSRAGEAAVTLGLAALLALLAFGPPSSAFPLVFCPYMLLLPVMWAAYRFGARGVTAVLALTGSIALIYTVSGSSSFPLGGDDLLGRVTMVQLYLWLATVMGLLLSAVQEERSRALALASTQASQLQLLGDNIPGSIVFQIRRRADARLQVIYISAGVASVRGLGPGTVLADSEAYWGQIVEEHRQPLNDAYAQSAREMSPLEFDACFHHPDGVGRWIRMRASPRRTPDGGIIWDGSETDITRQKESEWQLRSGQESLRVSAERLGVALRASRLGIWGQNLSTRESEFDPRAFEIFGLPPTSKAPGFESILALVHEEDRPAVEHSWLGSPAHGRDHQLRFRILTRDGGVRHIKMHGIVHADAQGRPQTSVAIVGDVTDIVESAGEAARLRAQLIQSQKMESLGTLAAGVAHDFNNLLTSITLFLEMAAIQVSGNHEAAGLLVEARRGALNARDLVGLILNYSRRREGAGRTRLDLNRIVRELTPLIAAATPATVGVSADLCPFSLMVVADQCEIQQILMNLCVNGAHALKGKRGVVKISLSRHEIGPGPRRLRVGECAPGGYARLTVADSGCGMDEALVGRIFEPFFTTKPGTEGTGLGLAIVREVVTGHGGAIEVESRPGGGTTFEIFLPLAAGEAPAAPRAALPGPPTPEQAE